MFQNLVPRTVILMVSVCQDSVNVTQDGRGQHAKCSLVILVAISMVLVLLGLVLACKAGEGHTAPWMDVLMPAQAMVCAPTVLLVCPVHAGARKDGLEQTALFSWRWSVMISLTMMKVN